MSKIITDFEALYQNNRAIQVKANNPEVNELLRQNNNMLIAMFAEAFPWTFTDALQIEDFDFKRFFGLLKKYRILAWCNIPALKSLIFSMMAFDAARFGLDEIPNIGEILMK